MDLKPQHERRSGTRLDVATIYRRHGEQIERWAHSLGGPLVDAEEVVQEVLLVVQRRLHEFREEAKITTWLYRITQNIARKRRRRERLRRWLAGLPRDYASDLATADLQPVEELERREAAASVYAALDRLDERYRSVVVLFEIEGLSGEEIAELTGTKLATIWVWLHRGREQLRREYRRLARTRGAT